MRALGIVLLWAVLVVAGLLLGGLVWMLGLGILAHIFNAPNLAVGFWQSLLAGIVVNILLGGTVAFRRK